VGKQRVTATQVAVKMSNRTSHSHHSILHKNNKLGNNKNNHNNHNNNNKWLQSLTRDLAVISGLPHQNILTLHGVCESKQQQTTVNNHRASCYFFFFLVFLRLVFVDRV